MDKIIFTKYSNERAARFALRTDIVERDGLRFVRKSPLCAEGGAHVQSIAGWYQKLAGKYEGTRIGMNVCEPEKNGVRLEYLEGKTLEQILDGYLQKGETEKLTELLFSYLEEVKKGFTISGFTMTPQFQEVFGEVCLPEGLLCSDLTDIDMVLNNVIVNEKWTLIDYEWTFAFPIPYHFVVYWILNYYLNGSSTRRSLHELDLCHRAGLTDEELSEYEKMERHFQDVYVLSGGEKGAYVPLRDLYGEISPGSRDLTDMRFEEIRRREAMTVQVYEAPDESWDFQEETSQKRMPAANGVFEGTLTVSPKSRFVRIDPCACCCAVRDLSLRWGEEVSPCYTNGAAIGAREFFFATEDPQLIIERPPQAGNELRVRFQAEYLETGEALVRLRKLYEKQGLKLAGIRERLRQKENLIREMENTKVWKAYRRLKGKGK